MKITVQPLSPAHASMLGAFRCGVKFIDAYLRQGYDLQANNLARLFIAVNAADRAEMAGYYALHMMHIQARQTPAAVSEALRQDAVVGAAYIVNLAVHRDFHGQGIGKLLLQSALKRIRRVSEEAGIWAVVLDALNADAERFYRRYGFDTLVGGTRRLYLPVSAIA